MSLHNFSRAAVVLPCIGSANGNFLEDYHEDLLIPAYRKNHELYSRREGCNLCKDRAASSMGIESWVVPVW